MNNYLHIEVTGYTNRFLRKCHEHNISLLEINYPQEDIIIVKIMADDYKKMKRINYYAKVRIIKYEGINGLKRHVKLNIFTYIIIILSLALMDVLTSYIVRIDIIHENSGIRELLEDELASYNIKPFLLAKDFYELEEIKNNILENNQTKLEWLSITRYGMTYVVRAEERIITDITKEEGFGHIVSSKDALITRIEASNGSIMLRSGDYVKKGDIIISGEIKLFENVKSNILASGKVYGNVWYESQVKYPLDYENKTYTGKKRLNISFNNKILFHNKYQYFEQKNIRRLKIFGIKIVIYDEVEYQKEVGRYSLQEAEKLALKEVEKEVNRKLKGNGKVISKKVLKKEEINSTISMSVFIVTNELISVLESYTPGSDENDTTNSS